MNISIIGSCHSRDMFNSKFIPEYKEHFTLLSYYSMTSMLSLMSDPVGYKHTRLMNSSFKSCLIEHWYQEFEKTLLKTLESKQPDVLLMDFYGDARYGAVAYGGDYVINRTDKVVEAGIISKKNLGIVYSYEENTENFIMMWRNSFDRFMGFMKEKLPHTRIIINTMKGTNVVTDADGNVYLSPKIKDLDVDRINRLWSEFDYYAIHKYHLEAIRFEKTYTLDPNYPFGGLAWATVHFQKEYYRDCFNQLVELTSNVKSIPETESAINLVTDSAYKRELRNWTNIVGKFDLIDYGSFRAVQPVDSSESLGNYRPQMWSKPIEIKGDGKTSYTLSFYIKISNLAKIQDDMMVFAIRTFKYLQQTKAADVIETHKLKLEGHEIRENEEYRYVYTFTPKGQYMRVAPFMFQCIPGVEYSRIKLERAETVSEYTK